MAGQDVLEVKFQAKLPAGVTFSSMTTAVFVFKGSVTFDPTESFSRLTATNLSSSAGNEKRFEVPLIRGTQGYILISIRGDWSGNTLVEEHFIADEYPTVPLPHTSPGSVVPITTYGPYLVEPALLTDELTDSFEMEDSVAAKVQFFELPLGGATWPSVQSGNWLFWDPANAHVLSRSGTRVIYATPNHEHYLMIVGKGRFDASETGNPKDQEERSGVIRKYSGGSWISM